MSICVRAIVAGALLAVVASVAAQTSSADDLKARAEAGDVAAMRSLADAYYVGRDGLPEDLAEAARWYRKLAAAGHAVAQTRIGLMYARGLGVPQSYAEAKRWWELAAAQKDAGAQHNLGMLYFEGHGGARDPAQALTWFRRAANGGHATAQRVLGLMLFEGKGIPRDPETGLMWLTIAAQNGEETAERALRLVEKSTTAEQRERAQARAEEWRRANPALR